MQMDLIEAIHQRDLGIGHALDLKSQYRGLVESAIEYLAAVGTEFSSDDVRRIVGDPPPSVSTNVTGALFNAAAKAGIIRQAGTTISARVIGHGNLVRTWVGK